MEQRTWAGVRAVVLAFTVLFLLPLQVQAERNWEFSVGAFGGKAFHSNEDIKFNFGVGAGATAIGIELDFSRFTADLHPQRAGPQVPLSPLVSKLGLSSLPFPSISM
jgi:hypothetical protein